MESCEWRKEKVNIKEKKLRCDQDMKIWWIYYEDMMKIGRYEDMKMWFKDVIMWKYAYIIVVTKLNFFLV